MQILPLLIGTFTLVCSSLIFMRVIPWLAERQARGAVTPPTQFRRAIYEGARALAVKLAFWLDVHGRNGPSLTKAGRST